MFDEKLGYDPTSPESIESYAIQLKDTVVGFYGGLSMEYLTTEETWLIPSDLQKPGIRGKKKEIY